MSVYAILTVFLAVVVNSQDASDTDVSAAARIVVVYDPIDVPAQEVVSFQSENFPLNYPNYHRQTWTFVGLQDSLLRFDAVSFDLQSGRNGWGCMYDSLRIKEGQTLLGEFCGRAGPVQLLTTGNSANVVFDTDKQYTYFGFNITVRALPLRSSSTVDVPSSGFVSFQSENFPDKYLNSLHQKWTFVGPEESTLQFDEMDFHIESDELCTQDSLTIADTENDQLGIFCGSDGPNGLRSKTNLVTVDFTTNNRTVDTGFNITVRVAQPRIVTKNVPETGKVFFHSELYPLPYPRNIHQSWTFVGPKGSALKFESQKFYIYSSPPCTLNYLEIFDGSVSMGKYCKPAYIEVHTTTNMATVNFTAESGGYTYEAGFNFTVRAKPALLIQTVNVPANGIISFQSVNFPQLYPNDLDIQWNIVGPYGTTLQLDAVSFDINNDELRITADKSKFRYYEISGPAGLRTKDNTATVEFKTDLTGHAAGFNITVQVASIWITTINVPASGIVSFQSENFPLPYPINHRHRWVLVGPEGSTIQIYAESFHLGPAYQGKCDQDGLVINDSELKLGRFCHTSGPSGERTNSNTAVVDFYSDMISSATETGFNITVRVAPPLFNTVYVPKLEIISFQSEYYPQLYPRNINQTWTFIGPVGSSLQFDTVSFDLANCNDQVNIFESNDFYWGIFCKTGPDGLVTLGNKVTVEFLTERSSRQKGFNITVRVASLDLSTAVNVPESGIVAFQSEDFPLQYRNNLNQRWLFVGPVGSVLQFDASSFNLAIIGFDYVLITEGALILGQFMDSNGPIGLQTNGNTARVDFVSDHSFRATGFNITVRVKSPILQHFEFLTFDSNIDSSSTCIDLA